MGQCRELLINSFDFEFYNYVLTSFLWIIVMIVGFIFNAFTLKSRKVATLLHPRNYFHLTLGFLPVFCDIYKSRNNWLKRQQCLDWFLPSIVDYFVRGNSTEQAEVEPPASSRWSYWIFVWNFCLLKKKGNTSGTENSYSHTYNILYVENASRKQHCNFSVKYKCQRHA